VLGPDSRIRCRTLQLPGERLTRQEVREFEPYPEWAERPRLRSECENDARPCPFVSRRYHLYLDVLPSGNIKINHPGLTVWELAQSCALDVADLNGDGLQLEAVGDLMNITRERVRQMELGALMKIREFTARKEST